MKPSDRMKNELEANTLAMFSIFFLVLAVLVLAGSFWAMEKASTLAISLASGFALLAVAGIARYFSGVVRRRIAP